MNLVFFWKETASLLHSKTSEPFSGNMAYWLYINADILPSYDTEVVEPDIEIAQPLVDGHEGRTTTSGYGHIQSLI